MNNDKKLKKKLKKIQQQKVGKEMYRMLKHKRREELVQQGGFPWVLTWILLLSTCIAFWWLFLKVIF